MYIANGKKPVWKGYVWLLYDLYESYKILYDSNYITFWKSQNYRDSKNISGCLGWNEQKER